MAYIIIFSTCDAKTCLLLEKKKEPNQVQIIYETFNVITFLLGDEILLFNQLNIGKYDKYLIYLKVVFIE